jgi:hypothetical protein
MCRCPAISCKRQARARVRPRRRAVNAHITLPLRAGLHPVVGSADGGGNGGLGSGDAGNGARVDDVIPPSIGTLHIRPFTTIYDHSPFFGLQGAARARARGIRTARRVPSQYLPVRRGECGSAQLQHSIVEQKCKENIGIAPCADARGAAYGDAPARFACAASRWTYRRSPGCRRLHRAGASRAGR